MTYSEFKRKVLKLNDKRTHRVTNSLGVYDAFKYYRKNKPKDKKYVLTESQYYSIIRNINKLLAEELYNNKPIYLPLHMGVLELRKVQTSLKIVDGKLINSMPVNWEETLKLWASDEECFKNKTLVRLEEKEVFKVYYAKSMANYNNKIFYQFQLNRTVKRTLTQLIKDNKIEAFNLYGRATLEYKSNI